MSNYPYRWFKNIVALLEKRDYSTYRIFLFALFVGATRTLEEWVLGGSYPRVPLSSFVTVAGFYWLSFFVFTLVLRILVPQPWRVSINVILVGIFLGVFPPVLDTLISGPGFTYGYVWDFPAGWKLLIYNPAHHVPIGEAIVLWAVIIFTMLYVAHKTGSAIRAGAALLLAYGAVLLIATLLAELAEQIRAWFEWPGDHRVVTMNFLQVIATLLIYLLLQPKLRAGLLRRIPHTLPFILFCFLGSAITDRVSETTVIYAGLLFLAGLVALGQNDYFDVQEDRAQGRETYLDLEDVRFITITAVLGIVVLASANSTALFSATTAFVAFSLYNFPFYRAKRYFPSNLKIEGIWGFTAFAFGVVAAVEHAAYGGPRWWASGLPMPLKPEALRAFDITTIAALFLAFGGFSLVSALKDYKDWEADLAAGVQTPYTLGARRGWNLRKIHRFVTVSSALAVAVAPVLLAAAGKFVWHYTAAGVVAGGLLWVILRGEPSEKRFRLGLVVLAAYFAALVWGLSFPAL